MVLLMLLKSCLPPHCEIVTAVQCDLIACHSTAEIRCIDKMEAPDEFTAPMRET